MAIQSHIHLGSTLGGSPELAPAIKWKVLRGGGRVEQQQSFVSVRYSLTGVVRPNVLKEGGTPVRRTDIQLRLLVREHDGYTTAQRVAALKAMAGTYVKFVDIDHPADGADHTSAVRDMFFSQLGPFPDDHPMLDFFIVDVLLLDATGAV